jgi:hypothetical protein
MTLFEFQKKLPTVSDRRLVRMLERARQDGLEPAVDLILAEQKRRKADGRITVFLSPEMPLAEVGKTADPSPSFSTQPPFVEEDLSSQIRPLEEVLGRNFDWRPTGHPRKAPPEKPVDLSALEMEMNDPQPVYPGEEKTVPDSEPEEMAPLNPTTQVLQKSPKWQTLEREAVQRQEPLAPLSDPKGAESKRGWIILAILLLMLAGFLAIWRALVG